MLRVRLVILLLCTTLMVAHADTLPKYEMRAVWLTTNWGLDWPSAPARNPREAARQQQELRNMLDALAYMGFNTIFFQARIRGEVFYPSAYEPWSRIVSGTAGKSPGYDPLAFVIKECHDRGMECHAWMVTIPAGNVRQAAKMGSKALPAKHPELCKKLKGNWYLDPGNPATSHYIAALVAEIVSRYDIDGIHLDYIRYPDEEGNFPDADSYRRYAPAGMSRHQWHVANISRIVAAVSDTVAALNPHVMVSTAPLGRYTSLPGLPPAHWSCTEGAAQDAVAWLRQGDNDFVAPMMYYTGENFFPYLADWVARATQGYIVAGLGAYRLERTEGNWDVTEIQHQIAASRQYGAAGQAFFRARHLLRFPALALLLAGNYYRYPALVPPQPTDSSRLQPQVNSVTSLCLHRGTLCDTLSWQPATHAARYAIYASVSDSICIDDPAYLIHSWVTDTTVTLEAARYRTFAVTAIDSTRRESPAAIIQVQRLRKLPHIYQ